MCSRTDSRLRAALAATVVTTALSLQAGAVPGGSVQPDGRSPGTVEIARALDIVRTDPNLSPERTIKTLRWRSAPESGQSRTPGWLAWLADLFGWLDQSSRILVWCAAALLAALLLLYLVGLVRRFNVPVRDEPFLAPTHVRDLDIRPETLPRDIGAAARALWDRGDHRMALALLYRGLLSRLAHVHGIPIRDSSTEGDCLALAEGHLTEGKREYASRVVRVWQRAVYGREDIEAGTVYVLCDDFTPSLDGAAALDSAPPGGPA